MKKAISSETPSKIGADKIAFPPKPDGRTYAWTDRHTDGQTSVIIE